ncbi:odorant receptor 4-like [Odontomachus brunneus]|uniref:odorant receptor 4-like n=1 Tax=Odontomachus brunneus TaxID=486640 RepID=UPI0013F2193A|nr:odorant receptor 4-like [Odontomachus brunneus]
MLPTRTIDSRIEFTLRLIGVWPDSSCKILLPAFWATVMMASQIFQYWYIYTHIGIDTLPDLLYCLSLCLSNTLLFLKVNVLWLNRRIVFDILMTMTEDWNMLSSISSKTQMVDKAILSHRFSKCIIGAYTCMILLGIANMKGMDSLQADGQRQLAVKMNLPFDYNASPIYEIVMATQVLLQYTLAIMAAMLSAFTVSLVLHIAGQIEIICQELLEISVTEDESRIAALRTLVNKHQRIIAFVDSVENVFCYMSLMQFFSNTLVICFLGFLIMTSLDSNLVLVKITPYYIVVNVEAFILCFTGEYLTSKSKHISQFAYASLWYELKPTESKILMLLILRSQKQLTITAGKFVELSLESFTQILKASASYMSVLRVMY